MNFCPDCYEIEIPGCAGAYIVEGLLTAFTEYKATVTDRHGVVYSLTETTDQGGDFAIDADDFPDGFFSEGTTITIEFRDSLTDCDPLNLTICDVVYSCIKLRVNSDTTDSETWNVLCNCAI
jgi:hypothetical protein